MREKNMRLRTSLWSLLFAYLLLSAASCLEVDHTFSQIPPGPWRGVLRLDPRAVTPNPRGEPLPEKLNLTFEEVTGGELPFNFEVEYTSDTSFQIILINGEERQVVDNITFGNTKSRVKDTIRINFPVYDTYLIGFYEEDRIAGEWVVNYRENYRIPFEARFGQDHRFTTLSKEPAADLTGTWKVTFGPGGDEAEPYPAIGEFRQEGNHLTGTFRTETGDYRYLEGTVQANKVYLSVFDGSHAFLFEALINDDETLVGSFRSGTHYKTVWEARRDSEAALADPMDLTGAVSGDASIDFTFPTSEGDSVSLSDEMFRGKVKLVQVMGTWCPNCRDETNYLMDYLAETNRDDLAVIALAFERYTEPARSLAAIERYREEMEVPYPVLYAGYYDKAQAAQALPMLNRVISYPTLLFIDRENRVRHVHTGFNGPATSQYAQFDQAFRATVDRLLAE